MAKAAKATKTDKIAAQAASRPKARRLKGKYSEMDIKATGPMPEWHDVDKLTPEQLVRRWQSGKYFYYYHHDAKELRPFVVELYGKDWTKKQHKDFSKVKDSLISPHLGAICKMILDGAKWPEGSKAWADKQVAKALEIGAGEADPEAPKEEPKKVINIQDRLQEIREETIGDLECIEDDFIRTRKMPNVNIMTWLRQKNIPQQIIPAMIDFYAERLAFMMEVKEGKDAQLKEGFAHLKKKDVDVWIKWYNDVITDLDGYKRVKVAARKPRMRKAQPPEKLARKMKYQKDAPDVGVTSVHPKEIVNATVVWVYNTKTRKLGRYVASEQDKSMTVKGSTILGWDPKLSVAKTLRKPKEQLKEFMDSGKVQLRTFLDKIKATEVKLNGRTNDQTIIVRADK
jgi:hypothetical protein